MCKNANWESMNHKFLNKLIKISDDEFDLAFDINTTKTGLINKEDAVGSLNLHSNILFIPLKIH